MRRFLRILLSVVGLGLGCGLVSLVVYNLRFPGYEYVMRYTTLAPVLIAIYAAAAILFGLIFYIRSPRILDGIQRLIQRMENWIRSTPALDILFGVLGMMLGLVLAFLASFAVNVIDVPVLPDLVSMGLYILLGWMGYRFGITRRSDILAGITQSGGDAARPKVLDTSVIIDGRIYDICKSGFVEGKLIVPSFVLRELRHIADSSDAMKRNRGRRGLDIIKSMQETLGQSVVIEERDYDDVSEVDLKLLRLAQDLNGVLVTNDYNLNKVASLQKMSVLNINDLANAIKPILLPSEELELLIVKEGKEAGQGVGYLDDGTMVIVEGGKRCIGEKKQLLVTSALQTSAGRLVFAKIK